MAVFDGLKNFPELEGSIDASVILGVQGPPGPTGPVGPRGPEGPVGKPFVYEDFTPEQLEKLRGPQGDPFTYEDFTPEQLEALKGNDGITPHIGENGNWFIGETDTGVAAGGNGSGGNVDLTGYATEQFVRDGYQPKGDYLKSTELTDAVNDALAQAKASGEFDGKDGQDGNDGTSVTVKSVSESTADGGENVVTFSDGKTLRVKNGKTGAAGADGKDGYTPVKGVDYFDGEPGKDGAPGADGKTPVKGTDYWTTADRQQMVADVLAALPAAEGGSF